MNIIKTLIFSFSLFLFIFCCPIISFASIVYPDFDPALNIDNGDGTITVVGDTTQLVSYTLNITTVGTSHVFPKNVYVSVNNSGAGLFQNPSFGYFMIWNGVGQASTLYQYTFNRSGGGTYRQDVAYSVNNVTGSPKTTSYSLNLPFFNNREGVDAYFTNGDMSGLLNDNIANPSIDPSSLGFIKPSYYVNNALLTGPMTVADSPETITWDNTSTTGYDLNQNGVQIRFMIKDRSVYQRNENAWGTGTLGTINNFITNVTGFLSSNLFPNGSWQKSWLRGDVTRSDTHEKFFGQKFTYPGSRGKASFNWLASYRDHPQIQISTYANDMLSTNKSFYESLYQNTLGDFTIPYISWDIYAQIIAPDGTEGNWLKIDKHAAPFQEQGNRLDGGVTDEPVKINPSIPDNNTWNDGDETPLEDDDDDDDPLPVGYVDPGSGDTYNEYNNYTYNYDNRSWIENHYDNSTVEAVNEGIDWIKLFPGFFGLFLKFFGAFLPSWAVACVTIGIPIILGLILFRLIKGVIPFV